MTRRRTEAASSMRWLGNLWDDRTRCEGGYRRLVDWTDGCIAVTNAEMDETWDSVEIGTPVEIRP